MREGLERLPKGGVQREGRVVRGGGGRGRREGAAD